MNQQVQSIETQGSNVSYEKLESKRTFGNNMPLKRYDTQKNPYSVEKVISQTQNNIVYLVNDGQQRYNIKRIINDSKQAKYEIEIMNLCSHPHIVRLINTIRSIEHIDLLMSYMPDTITKLIAQHKLASTHIPNLIIKIYAYQLLRAVNYFTSMEIVHNDLRPDNILINQQNLMLNVCNFGESFIRKTVRSSKVSVYSSPEILMGTDQYDYIDMWAVGLYQIYNQFEGCILCEMLLKEPIFQGIQAEEVLLSQFRIIGTNPQYKMPRIRRQPLIKFLIRSHPDPLLVNLISQIFVYKDRISPFQALQHNYFDQLREQNFNITQQVVPDFFNFNEHEFQDASQDEVNNLIPKWVYDRMSDAESVISQEKSDELDIDDMAEIKNYFYENTIVSHLLN